MKRPESGRERDKREIIWPPKASRCVEMGLWQDKAPAADDWQTIMPVALDAPAPLPECS